MSDPKTNNPPVADRSGETRLRTGALSRDEKHVDVEQSATIQADDTDLVLRTDGEEDTLYDDGLELEDGSRPLKGINGKDDT
jgi:hypothetical protein